MGDFVIAIESEDGYHLSLGFESGFASRMKLDDYYTIKHLKYVRVDKIRDNTIFAGDYSFNIEYVYKIENVAKYRLTMFTNNCYLDMNVDESVLSQLKAGDVVRFLTPTMFVEEHDATIFEDDEDLCILKDESWFHLTKNYSFHRDGKPLNL